MAFKEVEADPHESSSFFKFNAIGDKFAGVFKSYSQKDGTYGPEHNYVFQTKEGAITVNAKTDLHKKLQKAALKPGYKVIASYASDLDTGKPSPMKIFKVLVDSEVAAPKPKEADPFEGI